MSDSQDKPSAAIALVNEMISKLNTSMESTPIVEEIDLVEVSELELAEAPPGERISGGGIRYTIGGLPTYKDKNAKFYPSLARGMRHDHGQYWAWFLSSDTYRGALKDVEEAVRSGAWIFEYAQEIPPELEAAANERLAYLNGTWDQDFLHNHGRESLHRLISGFALFEQVWSPERQRVELEIILPHQVERWIVDKPQREWLACKLYEVGEPIPSGKLLHYAHNAYGLDLEGNSPLRSVGLLIQLQQDLLRLYAISAAAHGVPWTWITSEDPDADTGDDRRLVEVVGRAQGADRPVFRLKSGHKIEMSSPQGQMPDFLEMIRYLDERITSILKADGVLLGHSQHGSYALADSKDGRSMRQARTYGDEIASKLTSLIPEVLSYVFDDPSVDGLFPRLRFDLGLDDTRWDGQELVALAQAGLIEVTDDVKKLVHERYGLPLPSEKELKDDAKEADTEE